MPEADLYGPLNRFLEAQGYEVVGDEPDAARAPLRIRCLSAQIEQLFCGRSLRTFGSGCGSSAAAAPGKISLYGTEGRATRQLAGLPEHERGKWSRHSDLNRGPAVYEVEGMPSVGRPVSRSSFRAQLELCGQPPRYAMVAPSYS